MKIRILIALVILSTFTAVSRTEAQEIEIFSENFEGELENWNLEPGWRVVDQEGGRVLEGTEHSFTKTSPGGDVVLLEAKVKILKGGLHVSFRTHETPEGQTRYFFGLNSFSTYLQKEDGMDFQTLAPERRGISLGRWHEVKIETKEKKIRIWVDGEPLFEVEDKNFLEGRGISFETLENSLAYVDDVRGEMIVPEPKEVFARDLFPQGVHEGDLALSGGDFLVLENGKFEQFGNIYLQDNARLIIRNAELKISRYQRLLNHWGIELSGNASLEVSDSKLIPGEETLFIVNGRDSATIELKNSPTQIHLFQMFNRAKAQVENSKIVGEIGGLVSANDAAEIQVRNSKIGAVNLSIPRDATFEASGLDTGLFRDWNLQRDTKTSGIHYNVILQNTELVPDRIGPGPFERGWPVFIDSSAKVNIKDSQLRKVVIALHDEKAEFSGFVIGKPTSFHYRDISLENVKVMGQWGIFPHGSSDVVVRDSEEFWTFMYDDAKLKLVNTHLDEFDPRNFRGEIIFENSRWDTAAEIINNNDFQMSGSLEIGEIGGFSWEDSNVTRTFPVVGKPKSQLALTKDEESVWSGSADENGQAELSLNFDDDNFNDVWLLEDDAGNRQEITFFSKTPVEMEKSDVSKFFEKMKRNAPSGPPPLSVRLGIPAVVLLILACFSLFWLKRARKR